MNKGFHEKDPSAMAESYRNLEKLFGADKAGRTVELPNSDDDKAGWDKLYARLGRPESPDKYSFGDEGADPELVAWAKGTFHELGLTDKSASALMAKYRELETAKSEQMRQQMEHKHNEEIGALKKEWGAAYDTKLAQIDSVAQKLGLDNDAILGLKNAMGPAKACKFIDGLYAKLGDDALVEPTGREPSVLTPAQATMKRNELLGDKLFMEAWQKPNHPGHAEAVARMTNVSRMIYGRK